MEKVKIGFVGVGGMGQVAHLRNYVTHSGCEVVAIAELREDVRTRVAARYGIPKTYTRFEEMLENEKLDGIVASQPFMRHGVLLTALFQAKTPVLSEKPLAASIQVGERILAAAQATGVSYYVGYHKRSDPAVMYAKKEIEELRESGELGRLKYVRIVSPVGDWIQGGFDGLISGPRAEGLEMDPPAPDMDAATYAAYSTFVNVYIHQINLMRHLLGEDYAMKYAERNGLMLAVESASGIPGVIEIAPYTTTLAWQEEAMVCFEKGYVRIAIPAPLVVNRCGEVSIYKDPGNGATPQEIRPQMPWVHAFKQQAINFCNAIQGEKTPLCGPEDALKDLKVSLDYTLMKGK